MSFLARFASGATRFLSRSAPAISYLSRNAPRAFATAAAVASNPVAQQVAQKIGVGPQVMRGLAAGANNVASAINLMPGAVRDMRAAAQGAMQAADPARRSLAELYRTAQGM